MIIRTIRTIRRIRALMRTIVGILVLALLPLAAFATDMNTEDDAQDAQGYDSKIAFSKKTKAVNYSAVDVFAGGHPLSCIMPDQIQVSCLMPQRNAVVEAMIRLGIARPIVPAMARVNNYGKALQEYLSLLNALNHEACLEHQAHLPRSLQCIRPAVQFSARADFIQSFTETIIELQTEKRCRITETDDGRLFLRS